MMKFCLPILLVLFVSCSNSLPENTGQVDSQLYLGKGDNQPLIVALGGGDGGNSWTGNRVKMKRDKLVNSGYAFLAIGYFGTKNSPDVLDRISLDAIHQEIIEVAKNKKIDSDRVAILGISKGAELALLLASHFEDISCVVAMAPSHCSFPAHTLSASTSSWTYQGEEVPYVPMPWSAVPATISHDLLSAFTIMLEDQEAVENSFIKVENIKGSILLLSAKNDEQWPSTQMSNAIVERLQEKQFRFPYLHVAIDGKHSEVFDHFDNISTFLNKHFPPNNALFFTE